MDSSQFKASYENIRMGFAFSDASYDALNEHMENLEKLRSQLNSTTTIKEAQDLANAIALENAQIQVITAKLGAVQNNLSATSGSKSVTNAQSYNAWMGE